MSIPEADVQASRRDLIEDAFEKDIELNAEPETETELDGDRNEPRPHNDQADPETRPTPESEKPEDPAKTEAKAAKEQLKSPQDRKAPAKQDAESAKVSGDTKAPLGWGPNRDALWSKVADPEIRALIAKRETEIQTAMSQAGNIRLVADEYRGVITPFRDIFQQMGVQPKEALVEVMKTATGMIVGTQEQKCAILAEMISRYGVDLPTLDKTLTGHLEKMKSDPTYGRLPANTQMPLDPRLMQQLKPLFDLRDQAVGRQQAQQKQMEDRAAADIERMRSQPHFEMLQDDIADIIDVATKRGRTITIDEAYKMAATLHPEVSRANEQRNAANQVSQAASTLARARKAASSVKGAPGGQSKAANDRRAALEAAWESQ